MATPLPGQSQSNEPASVPNSLAETGITWQSLFGWAVLFVALVALSEVPALEDLASAFALLILITTLMAFGPKAFDNVNGLFKES